MDIHISNEYRDVSSEVSSSVSSNEMSILSEGTDEETEEITGTSLEPYHFEPIDANASNIDQLKLMSHHLMKRWYLRNYLMI